MENKKRKILKFNKKTIDILTFLLYMLAMVIFEIGYCYAQFSLCRVVMYAIFMIIIYFTKNKFTDDAIKSLENKHKKILIKLYFILGTITLIIATIIIIINPLLSRGISIGMISILMGGVFIIYVSNNIIKNIIVTAFSIGLVFTITTEFNHPIDEKKHFMSAFNIAFGNLDYVENPITDSAIEALPQLSKFTTIDEFIGKKYEPNITNEVNMQDIPSTPANYNFITYLFPATGIWIAKTIGGSIIDLYILGRIFNLILYTILICTAIKLIPYKKNILAVIFLMPMSMILAASYSIDGFCIGMVAIFIAYCLKIKKEKETISLRDFFILLGIFFLTLLAKSMAYVLVGFLIFTLPIKATLKKNKKYIPIMITIAIIAIVLLTFIIIKVKETHVTADFRGGSNISVSGQLMHMLQNPIFDIQLMLNHINNTLLNFHWYTMLHDSKFFTEYTQCVLIPLLLFILYVSLTEDDYHFKIKDKVIMILSFLLVYGMTSMVLYLTFTEVGSLSIGGYQTRYILPILPLILFCLSNKNIMIKNKQNRNFNIATISGIFIMLGLMQCILV